MKKILFYILFCTTVFATSAFAQINVKDDMGRVINLPKPAQRIISTAPHLTEFLFAIGGGDRLVGVTSYSNYPEVARALIQVGDNRQIDIERVLSLRPDLLIVWKGGNTEHQLRQLEKLGIPIYFSNIKKTEDIAETMNRLGHLVGLEKNAQQKGDEIKSRFQALANKYSTRPVMRVFYQISDKPLYTLNGQHIISHVIQTCGGKNVFSDLMVLAPNVSVEGVLERNPEVIFSSGTDGVGKGLSLWRRYTMLNAVRYQNLFEINPDLLDRPGPRMIEGAEIVCKKMEEARRNQKRR